MSEEKCEKCTGRDEKTRESKLEIEKEKGTKKTGASSPPLWVGDQPPHLTLFA